MQAPAQEADVDDEEAVRLQRAAERFEEEARVLTLFDRNGKVTARVGERAIFFAPTLSPAADRIAVSVSDPFAERVDLWVYDVATGERTRITEHAHADTEWATTPIWSPDGTELVYAGKRQGFSGIYRKSADGSGEEELLYRHPGANMLIGDWSLDGQYISISTADFTESFLYILPMAGEGERDVREILHSDAFLTAGSFSPDGKSLSYSWQKSGETEIYLKDIDSDSPGRPISDGKGLLLIRGAWHEEPNSIFYLATGEVVTTATANGTDTSELTTKALFTLSPAIRPGPEHVGVSRDGEHLVIAVPHTPRLEQISLLDRQGNVVQRLGEPSIWRNPSLSRDGRKVAVRAWMPETDTFDIWTFDIKSGESVAVTEDLDHNDWPVWSHDSTELVFVSSRDILSQIHRKAADGSGSGKALFEYEPGAFLVVSDWSPDGKYVSFNDISWGVIYILPVGDEMQTVEGNVMEWQRDEYQVAQGKFSPDGRHIAYLTDEAEFEVFNLFIAPFDPNEPHGRVEDARPLLVSDDDVIGMVSWREDGRELYYLTSDWKVMAVTVSTEPEIEAGEPRMLFELPGPLSGEPRQWQNISPDGERFVFVLKVPVDIG